MAKPKRRYVCTECGSVATRWQGQCVDCEQWNTLVEETPATVFSTRHDLSSGGRPIAFEPLDAPSEALTRRTTGLAERGRRSVLRLAEGLEGVLLGGGSHARLLGVAVLAKARSGASERIGHTTKAAGLVERASLGRAATVVVKTSKLRTHTASTAHGSLLVLAESSSVCGR